MTWLKFKKILIFGLKSSTGIKSWYLVLAIQVIMKLKYNIMLTFLSLKSQLQREVEGVLWRMREGSLMAAFLHGTICCCRNEVRRQLFMQIKCLTNPHEKVCTALIRKKCSLMPILRLFPEQIPHQPKFLSASLC